MLEFLRAVARFLDEKIGWNRIGVAVSLLIIAVALHVLYGMVHDLDFGDVMTALRSTPPSHVVLAALFVAAGYFTLTFYDLFALRTVQVNLPPMNHGGIQVAFIGKQHEVLGVGLVSLGVDRQQVLGHALAGALDNQASLLIDKPIQPLAALAHALAKRLVFRSCSGRLILRREDGLHATAKDAVQGIVIRL